MDSEKIQLRKIRDFGENFSDTFQFIKQEFKPLMISYGAIGIGFILATVLLSGVYAAQISAVIPTGSTNISMSQLLSVYNGTFFLILFFGVCSFSIMLTVVAVYMKHYDEFGESPDVNQVWQGCLRYLLRNIVLAIIQIALFFAGFIFCFAPGFYFLFVLMPFAFVTVNEDATIGLAFSRCFELIKENFWSTAGLYIVVTIVVFVFSLIVGLFFGLISGAGSLFSLQQFESSGTIVRAVSTVFQYFFYIILYVSVGLNYYNLTEKRDGTGLAKKIESLGLDTNANDGIEEEY